MGAPVPPVLTPNRGLSGLQVLPPPGEVARRAGGACRVKSILCPSGSSSLGRARPCQGRGSGFEARLPLHPFRSGGSQALERPLAATRVDNECRATSENQAG